MFALVESGSITKMLSGNRGITIGNVQYPNLYLLYGPSLKEKLLVFMK